MAEDFVIEMLNITKEFPGIKANDNITLQLRKGEVHALLGENGAGKSTLMSVLFGLYQPEQGIIKKNGDRQAVEEGNLRKHLVEEMADVLMYYNDVLLCYGISEEELKEAYTTKFEKNRNRW